MAGCVMGGLQSIAGAVIGGLLITLIQKGLTIFLISQFGIAAADWEGLIPSLVIIAVLMIEPEGIMSIFSNSNTSSKNLREIFTRKRSQAEKD
jgi:branched-subunit amino acid ABC-type transport system permease component